MRRLKRGTTLLQRSGNCFRSRRLADYTQFCEENRGSECRRGCGGRRADCGGNRASHASVKCSDIAAATESVSGQQLIFPIPVLDRHRNPGFLKTALT
jgi:hypothetical protein